MSTSAQIAEVLAGLANGTIKAPEGFTGLENVKQRPIGEWTFDDVTDEQIEKLVSFNYSGKTPVNRGQAAALLLDLVPKPTRGRKKGWRKKKFTVSDANANNPASDAQLRRLFNRYGYGALPQDWNPEIARPTMLEAHNKMAELEAVKNGETETDFEEEPIAANLPAVDCGF